MHSVTLITKLTLILFVAFELRVECARLGTGKIYRSVKTIDRLLEIVSENYGKSIFVEFIGSLREDGESWCPDCRRAEPIVKSALYELPENAVFVVVEVGDRDAWKSSSNPFRRNKACDIKSIPTIIQFGTNKRLSDEDVECREKIVNLFKEVS
uniref:Thioredoxin domain-containing protein 17 n=1 Tax=Fasciola gigantica TaxID=46835 RepID=A0A6M3U4K9_FASGI|nr:thioredoxin-related protein 14 [Fasciola gigantica]